MTVSRLRTRPRPGESFGRAKTSGWTTLLLVALRIYAISAVGIAIYAFFRALH